GLLAAAMAIAVTIVTRYPHSALIVHDGLLALGGAALVTAGLSVIRRGLSPVAMLRERLSDVRHGRSSRLEGEYPDEVAPLVDDLNRLLEDRERRVARAAARAGDLAHGLKTPLAILAQEIARAGAAGQHDLAGSIRQQVARMQRQIDSHLAQARATAGASATARTNVADAVAGLSAAMRGQVLQRGVRADEASPGSGLGLAIVRDLAAAYGGAIALDQSSL